jgi:hypothetical protein
MRQDVKGLIDRLRLTHRHWEILACRVDKSLTLEEIGKQLDGLSRQRVCQLELQAHRKLKQNLKVIKPVLNTLEVNIGKQCRANGKRVEQAGELRDAEMLADQFVQILESDSYLATRDDAVNIILLLRALVLLDDAHVGKRHENTWPDTTYIACMLTPPVMQHQKVATVVEHEYQEHRNLSYKKVIYQVLAQAGEPLHWSTIVERAYQLNRRASFDSTALYNALLRYKSIFVRVGQGKYALAEWGVDEVDSYPNIIATVLEQERKTLPLDRIYSRVNLVRSIKMQSLIMYLEMHPRFYKSLESTYGLRSWLSPRDQQTLRTPEWLVEESSSFERLERAARRGYRIESVESTESET